MLTVPPEELVAEAGPSGCGKILASVQFLLKKLKQPLEAQLPELQQHRSALNTVERWVHPPGAHSSCGHCASLSASRGSFRRARGGSSPEALDWSRLN
ncbi:hypothetical protein GW17_00029307 [Ensete ventricosum]|nr:hypothetical protein GW17_00029307 [Ensete ventricosum]